MATTETDNEILEIVIDGFKEGKDDAFIYYKMLHRTSLSAKKIAALRENYNYITAQIAECRALFGR